MTVLDTRDQAIKNSLDHALFFSTAVDRVKQAIEMKENELEVDLVMLKYVEGEKKKHLDMYYRLKEIKDREEEEERLEV